MVADRQGTNARQLVSPDRPERDKAAKAMLPDKQIFSLVLKLMCPEYAEFTVRELSSRIQEAFRMPLSAANELAVLNEKMETMDPALTVAMEGTTVNDQVCVIQDMETEKLYVVIIVVNNTVPTAEVMANRNDCCIARGISGQQNRIKGMNTDCAGLNDLKMFWIYPTAIFSDALIITWEVKARHGNARVIREFSRITETHVENRFVFIGPEWDDLEDRTLNGLGHIFRNRNRREALEYMEKEGVAMTAAFRFLAPGWRRRTGSWKTATGESRNRKPNWPATKRTEFAWPANSIRSGRDRQYTDAPAFLLPRFQTRPGLALICNVCFSCREQVGAACLSLQKKPALSVVFSNRNSRFSVQ